MNRALVCLASLFIHLLIPSFSLALGTTTRLDEYRTSRAGIQLPRHRARHDNRSIPIRVRVLLGEALILNVIFNFNYDCALGRRRQPPGGGWRIHVLSFVSSIIEICEITIHVSNPV